MQMNTQEAGQRFPDTYIVDDGLLLGKEPGKIAKITVFSKTFICGIQITYADGSTSGPHIGFMEPELPPVVTELIIDPSDNLELISGYVGDYVGAIHIKTSFGNTLDAGKIPTGNLFALKATGSIIQKLYYGISGYLTYFYAVFSSSVAPFPMYTYPILPQPQNPGYPPQPVFPAQPAVVPTQQIKLPKIEFTALCGKDDKRAVEFDDFKSVVQQAIKAGSQVRIARVKVYHGSGYILGMKTKYEIVDYAGKKTFQTEMHKSKVVGMLTSRAKYVFPPGDSISQIHGRYLDAIKKVLFIDNHGKTVLEAGVNEGGEFLALPYNHGPIIAFAGSMWNYLNTLKAYAKYE